MRRSGSMEGSEGSSFILSHSSTVLVILTHVVL